MRFFIDLEFWERGPSFPIQLISLAIVSEGGDELYIVNDDFDWEACDSKWLKDNVEPKVRDKMPLFLGFDSIREIVYAWVLRMAGGKAPEFWAYFGAYDWVVFAQIFGTMNDLPKEFPMYFFEINQLAEMTGVPIAEVPQEDEHHALSDARWAKAYFDRVHELVFAGMEEI